MPTSMRIDVHDGLDGEVAASVLDLVEAATAAEGHRPLGEHKYSQLEGGGEGSSWTAILAYADEGRLAGYAHLRWSEPAAAPREPAAAPRASAELVVAPASDAAVAGALLDAAEATVAAAGGGRLWLWCHRVEDPRSTLPARRGYRIQRSLAVLRRLLTSRPTPSPAPEGVEIRPYAGERDDAEFLRVNNAAFEGHPENGGWTPEVFAARRRLVWFDAADLLTAWEGERLLGFHWTKRHEEGSGEVTAQGEDQGGPVGEVYVLAVDPAAQGSGLGRHLLDAGLAHLYDRGCRDVVLYVDRASPGAVRLYEKAGFSTVYDEVCYERKIAAP